MHMETTFLCTVPVIVTTSDCVFNHLPVPNVFCVCLQTVLLSVILFVQDNRVVICRHISINQSLCGPPHLRKASHGICKCFTGIPKIRHTVRMWQYNVLFCFCSTLRNDLTVPQSTQRNRSILRPFVQRIILILPHTVHALKANCSAIHGN